MEKVRKGISPLVTIIIPVYNGADYMREAIDSALAQTYNNTEVIVVNDGSTDDTEKIARSYGSKIGYYSKKNGGVATALNLAIKKAKGEYISWLSHDDAYHPEKIAKQIDYIQEAGADRNEILYSNYYRLDTICGNSRENIMHPNLQFEYSKWFSLKLLFKADLHGCSLLIPKKCFEEVGYFDESLKTTQDYDLWFKFVQQGYYFRHIDSTLVMARSHAKQGTLASIDLCKKEIEGLYLKAVDIFIEDIKGQDCYEYEELIGYLKEKDLVGVVDYLSKKVNTSNEEGGALEKVKQFNPLVSIIIPVYNGSSYLGEAIDSALKQTYKNIEIIVVNDGSTDNTDEIAKSYGKKIRYFAKENGGAATALNIGIKNMKGQYFSWLSHDDMYYPNKIARQIEELGKLEDKNTIMMSDLDGINEKYEKIYQTDYFARINSYLPRLKSNIYPVVYNQTHGCTLLIPKVCFDEVGLFDAEQRVAQDFEFFYRAFLKFPHKLISEVLVTARDSSERVGVRCKGGANDEYSTLYIKIIENLTDEDIKLLAESKLVFYSDMRDFFQCAGYSIALEYLEEKIIKNLQISSYDLVGNKFNGYDLHLQLRDEGIDSNQLVLHKHSDDASTFVFDFLAEDATKRLIQQSIFLEADLVHLHLIHNIIDLNYLPIISRLKPTILSLHDPFFLGGHCVHHFDCKNWQTHCHDCPYLNEEFALDRDISALNFELKKEAIQNSQITTIVASKWMEDKVKQSPIWQGKKVYLLPFGVDQGLFKPVYVNFAKKSLNIPKDSTVIMFRADNGSFKGLDIVKRSLSNLKNPKNITLIGVGQLGLLDDFRGEFNVLEYDWIKDDNQLARLYQAADIFLMPSRQETFGMMAIEAMSCGKMVLALESDGSALSEVICSPECGLAVQEHTFGSELQRLLDNPQEIAKRGKMSLDYAQKKYSNDKYFEGMLKIYANVMSNHDLSESLGLISRQLKKVALKELSLGSMQENDEVVRRGVKSRIKSALRRILQHTSPAFRMLEGNRHRLNLLLEADRKNQVRVDTLLLEEEVQQKLLVEKSKDGSAILEKLEALETTVLKMQNHYIPEDRVDLNLLGEKLILKSGQKAEAVEYKCKLEEFMIEMGRYILGTEVVLDIGCGIRPQTFFTPKVHICIEPFEQYRQIVKPYFPNSSHFIFMKDDALKSIKTLDDQSVDTVFMIDLIEHLEKKAGLKLLEEADRVARKQIIVFTPLGLYPMHFGKADKDAWGLDGGGFQEHKSGWLPKDFGDSYNFHICIDCHEAFSEEDKKKGKRYSALMAIKTKEFNAFSVLEGTPEFVKSIHEERDPSKKTGV